MRKPIFGVPTRSDTYLHMQLQKMTRSLKFQVLEEEELYYGRVAKTKALISCTVTAVTAQLICAFVFAYIDQNLVFS